MNKKQAIAVVLIGIAIVFSITSVLINYVKDNIEEEKEVLKEDNSSVGTIQLVIEPQKGRFDSNARG